MYGKPRAPGNQCPHDDVKHLKEQEVWHCRDCGEVFKTEPGLWDDVDDDYMWDEYNRIGKDDEKETKDT